MSGAGSVPLAFPVSIKGVVFDKSERVLLLHNERQEWELPGGRIEVGETPEECVAREINEETQWKVTVGPILDAWIYYINVVQKNVFIVTFGCHLDHDTAPVLSHEHKEVGQFAIAEIGALVMPDGYRRSISTWYRHPLRVPQ